MNILVLNAGSSSLKFQVINTETEEVLGKGNFERIGDPSLSFVTIKYAGEKQEFNIPVNNHKEALSAIIEKLNEYVLVDGKKIDAVGHRVVHGGEKIKESVLITDEVIETAKECIPLAPLHNPACISGIEACKEVLPGVPSVAVFDTAFHQTIPEERYIYPIPYEYYEKYGIRKYGFHGISHDYVCHRLAEIKGVDVKDLKIINCHLGQGASLCAIDGGKSVETSMGFTPVAGIPMGTRCGDLDPSIVTFLAKNEGLTPDEIDTILNKKCGKLGVSGISNDDRDLETAIADGNERAKLTMDIFHYLVAQRIGAYMVSVGGADAITFAGGTGERGIWSRSEICKQLKCFGVEIDEQVNKDTFAIENKISTPNSKIEVWVVPTNEELLIAQDTERIVKAM